MAEELDPSGVDVVLGDVVLRTPGVAGTAELTVGERATGTRAAAPPDDVLDPLLRDAGVEVQHEVVLDGVDRLGADDGRRTRSAAGEPAIELDVPDPGPGWEQMIVAIDGPGIATWHFAPAPPPEAASVRGTALRTYRIRIPSPDPGGAAVSRGLLGIAGRAVIRVLAFRVIDEVLGRVGEHFAHAWEERHRPYRFRSFTPQDYVDPDGSPLAPADWERMGQGRALLFLHGTFSRAHTGFGQLPASTLADLHRRYRGRVLAFDHFTLSEDPGRNVDRFVDELPAQARLKLDVVCHSRGGLVARTLAERQSAISLGGHALEVGRVVFAGTPNAGTVLADPAQLGSLIDRYTTLLSFVPDNGVTDVLETIVTVAKTIAVGTLEGLSGLVSMRPGGRFLRDLDAGSGGPTAQYFALASNYEPTTPALRDWLRDRLTDALFGIDNDLVVPTDGVWSGSGAPRFPIARHHVFGPADEVAHSDYFKMGATTSKLLAWLPG